MPNDCIEDEEQKTALPAVVVGNAIKLEPHSVYVIESPHYINYEKRRAMQDLIEELAPGQNIKLFILDCGMKLARYVNPHAPISWPSPHE